MNIADVKKELSSDEKVLESAFKLETLYKKYKLIIWAIAIGLILFFISKNVMESMQKSKLNEANNAFITLEKNANNKNALKILKENNPKLFELYSYAQAIKNKDAESLSKLTSSNDTIISDISKYNKSVLKNKPYDSKLYKELSFLEKAYLAIKEGKLKEAQDKLALIDEKSQLSRVATLLRHATIKVK